MPARAPETSAEVLALMADPRWQADRDAVLTVTGLRGCPIPALYSDQGLAINGHLLWHEQSMLSTVSEALVDLIDDWYADIDAHDRVTTSIWQVLLYGIVHDLLLPAMGDTDYGVEFRPNLDAANAVRATAPRPAPDLLPGVATTVYVAWPELLARTIATINTFDRIRQTS